MGVNKMSLSGDIRAHRVRGEESAMNQDLLTPYRGTLISYNLLRRLVGTIGVALPVVLGLGGWWFFDLPLRPSISAYYYTVLGDWFVGSMCAFGVFLIAYRLGKLDNWIATIAGVLAVVVALVPTAPDKATDATERPLTAHIHLWSAAALFVLLAILSFLFATRRENYYEPARWRRRAHRICGGLILLSVAGSAWVIAKTGDDLTTGLFGVFEWEALGVLAFGVSWFMTGSPIVPKRGPPKAVQAKLPIIAVDEEPRASCPAKTGGCPPCDHDQGLTVHKRVSPAGGLA
jgi:hypothetical protein